MKPLRDDPDRAERTAEILRAVAHPLRLRLIALLCRGDHHVNGLAEHLEVPQPIVSQQLRILRLHGLVSVTRKNGRASYRLEERHLKNLVCCMEKVR